MSLFQSLMGGFDEDPFFEGPRTMMRQMDQMMNSMMRDPFENDPFFGPTPFPALAGPPRRHQQRALQPRDPFAALAFPNVSNLMTSINRMAEQGDCHTYSSSSVMTMTTGPDGRPTVYQASSSSHGAPGGVRETRRTVLDGHSGTKRMAIGHHIGDRAHIIEREQVHGNMEERQEFVNLDEDQAASFNKEFVDRTRGRESNAIGYRSRHHHMPSHRSRSHVPALTSSSYRRRSRPMLSITAGPSEDHGRREREERRQRFK